MSVSLLEVIEAGGYDLTLLEDAQWLLSKYTEFEELIKNAQALVDQEADRDLAESEIEYNRIFGGTE